MSPKTIINVEPVDVSFQPTQESFDYRWSVPHLLSFLMIAATIVADVAYPIQQSHRVDGSFVGTAMAVVAGTVLFGGFGLYFQLQGWNERVLLKDGMIVWIDCLRKTRVHCSYGALLDLKYRVDSSSNSQSLGTLKFVAPEGEFNANSRMNGFEILRSDMARLMTEIRKIRGERHVVSAVH